MRPAVTSYSFDVDAERLELIPLAARRALDRAGRKLALSAWQGLPRSQRRALVDLGSAPDVDVTAVARAVDGADPTPAPIPPLSDPPADAPPAEVVRAFAPHGSLTPAIWTSLSELDRYALAKLAASSDQERQRAAYSEIVGYKQVSTHVQASGGVHMVNVAAKADTRRRAVAETRVSCSPTAFELLSRNAVPKGDVLSTARIAGIMAAKRTSELIPLCHPLALTHLAVDLRLEPEAHAVHVLCTVETLGKTGVEMEALVGVTHAALTIYDMLKAVDRGMQIGPTRLLSKSGGASGDFVAGAAGAAAAVTLPGAERGGSDGA